MGRRQRPFGNSVSRCLAVESRVPFLIIISHCLLHHCRPHSCASFRLELAVENIPPLPKKRCLLSLQPPTHICVRDRYYSVPCLILVYFPLAPHTHYAMLVVIGHHENISIALFTFQISYPSAVLSPYTKPNNPPLSSLRKDTHTVKARERTRKVGGRTVRSGSRMENPPKMERGVRADRNGSVGCRFYSPLFPPSLRCVVVQFCLPLPWLRSCRVCYVTRCDACTYCPYAALLPVYP